MRLAITGATGFVGGHVLTRALQAGHEVRALTRRAQEQRKGVTWVEGALDSPGSLSELVEGAGAVIHIAGVINAPDAAGFEVGNVAGTAGMLAAAERAGVGRFVQVSSLAAREPGLSLYGASKARSEALVEASPLPSVIVRPPAVYGPGDRETLDLFRMAARGIVLLPPRGRLSLIHVDDLARLLLAVADPASPAGLLLEPDDGRVGAWTHEQFAIALGTAVGRRVATFHVPGTALRAGALLDGLVRRRKAKLTPDRAAYFCHPDWSVAPARGVPETLWKPMIATEAGLAGTAAWYRREGWL